MTETPNPRFTDANLVDALRALGIHSVRHPEHSAELGTAERAYLLGALMFAIESEVSLYASVQGIEHGPEAAYEVMGHMARGHAHTAAYMTGSDPFDTPDGMPRDVAPHWWLILADRLHLLSVQFMASETFGGTRMDSTPAHHHVTDMADGLADVVTGLTSLNYRIKGADPYASMEMLTSGAAVVETAAEFLRTTSRQVLDRIDKGDDE